MGLLRADKPGSLELDPERVEQAKQRARALLAESDDLYYRAYVLRCQAAQLGRTWGFVPSQEKDAPDPHPPWEDHLTNRSG